MRNRGGERRRIEAVIVARGVDLLEIQADERGPRLVRPRKPVERLVHARRRRGALVVRPPFARPHAADRRLASRPEHRRGAASLANRGRPQRLAAPPRRILGRLGRHAEPRGHRGILHRVGDDAVVRRIEAGDDRVVIRERERREGRDQRACADAARGERAQPRRVAAIDVVEAPAVERDEHEDRRPPAGVPATRVRHAPGTRQARA